MDNLIQQGINAYKSGDKENARKLLIAATKQFPNDEQSWGWLYNVCKTDHERIQCLQQVLRINPQNEKASQLLNKITLVNPPTELPENKINPNLSNSKLKKCPYCAELIQEEAIVCPHCRRDLNAVLTASIQNQANSQPKKQKKWYMQTWIKITAFVVFTPLWTLIVLDDPDENTWVKVVAVILLFLYLIFICPTVYRAFMGE
jgi:tetratricopeptide (TPR) repeat protein